MCSLQGKVIWITGASSGLGRALSLTLAAQGAKLILSSRNKEALEQLSNECALETSQRKVLALDLREAAHLKDKALQAWDLFGQIDILVNNAGIGQRALACETALEVDQEIMQVNYFAPVALSKALVPLMAKRGQGLIATIGSLTAHLAVPRRSAYCASKHALHGFFDSLRAEVYKSGVKVSMICPGYINTPFAEHALKGDGSISQVVTHRRTAVSMEKAARIITRALRRAPAHVVFGGPERFAYYAERIFPGLYRAALRRFF
jgi:short-subunit dehydrogenase